MRYESLGFFTENVRKCHFLNINQDMKLVFLGICDLTKDDECCIFFLISWNVKNDEVVNIFSEQKGNIFVLL